MNTCIFEENILTCSTSGCHANLKNATYDSEAILRYKLTCKDHSHVDWFVLEAK